MIINISFENDTDESFDENITCRIDLPFIPRIGEKLFLPELILKRLDRAIEDLPRLKQDQLFGSLLHLTPELDEEEHYFESFIYVVDVCTNMNEQYPVWIELSDEI